MDRIEGVAADTAFAGAITSLARDLPRLAGPAAQLRIAGLRRLAALQGRAAAVELADALGRSLARDRAATPIAAWLQALAEAGNARAAAASTPIYLATVGVHLAG